MYLSDKITIILELPYNVPTFTLCNLIPDSKMVVRAPRLLLILVLFLVLLQCILDSERGGNFFNLKFVKDYILTTNYNSEMFKLTANNY